MSTPEKIAVETVIEGDKAEYVRYKPESKSGVYDTESLAAFKMVCKLCQVAHTPRTCIRWFDHLSQIYLNLYVY